MLAERFGGKLPLLCGIFWTAVLTILTPVITHHGGFIGIVITRVLEGIGEVRNLVCDGCSLNNGNSKVVTLPFIEKVLEKHRRKKSHPTKKRKLSLMMTT